MKRFVHIVILGIILTTFNANSQLAVGEWRTHLAYSSVTQVAESPNFVFGYADGSLYSYSKSGGEINAYSKISGLNDNGIANIEYSKDNNLLFITYQNANIDLLMNDGVVNIPDFMNSDRPGDKTIYNVYIKENLAYLSTGVGIVVVDVVKHEIPATYKMKEDEETPLVYGTIMTDTEIFASTSEGVYKADKSANLLDPLNWTFTSSSPVGSRIVEYQGKIYLLKTSVGIYKYENSSWSLFLNNTGVVDLKISNSKMLVTTPSSIYSYDESMNFTAISGLSSAKAALYSTDNTYWVASGSEGLVQVKNTGEKLLTNIKPDGPMSSIYAMSFLNGKIYAVNGKQRDGGPNTPIMIYDISNDKWTNIQTSSITPYGLTNVNGILPSPSDPTHFFVSTALDGLFEFKNNQYANRYTKANSTIEGIFANNDRYQWITSLCFDKDENLWMFNSAFNSVKVLKKDGTWGSLYFSDMSKYEAERIFITSWDQKWVLANNWRKSVFVFDDEGKFNNQKYKWYGTFYDQDGLKIESSAYYSIVEDKNGSLWIGTDRGPIVFNNVKNNPDIVFGTNFYCTRIKIPRNDGTNYADYLLDSEQINAIAIDGGNRKWLGTSNSGLYLVSADGLQTINHFTKENSSLLSNNILSIIVEPTTGEVFVLTDKGLISYQGDAIEGKADYSNVYVYPNPVKPDYSGVISVTGLIRDSNVKITDISGNLIFEGQSQGGQLSWTGKNKSGERVSTGVYLVWGTNSDGSQSVVSKIMMIK